MKKRSKRICIRQMTEQDLPSILNMAVRKKWISGLAEFKMCIEFNPLGCFVCTDGEDKVVVGIMVFCHTRSALKFGNPTQLCYTVFQKEGI